MLLPGCLVVGVFYLYCENTKHSKLLNKHKTALLGQVFLFWLISTFLFMTAAMELSLLTSCITFVCVCCFVVFFLNTGKGGGGGKCFKKKGRGVGSLILHILVGPQFCWIAVETWDSATIFRTFLSSDSWYWKNSDALNLTSV